MNNDNPYDESNMVPLGDTLDSIDTGKSEFEKVIEETGVGLSWNDWVESVQWLSVRFTKGEDAPSEWSETYIRGMYADLQYYTFDDIQKSIIKLHGEGRSYAPNSSQIIGMCNKLGYRQVISRAQADRAAKGQYSECKGGANHSFTDWGWQYDEVGNPVYVEWCINTYSIDTSPCYAEREKSESVLTQYQKDIKPDPMTREKFIHTMNNIMKLGKRQQDELLKYRNRLQTNADIGIGEEE